jgi:hypothetical protein
LLLRQWVASSSLTRQHAIVWVIACSLIGNRNLACSDKASLDCCEVMAITSDYDMGITTLDRLYFMLSYLLIAPNALSMLYGRRAGGGDTCALTRPHLH